MKVFLGGTCNDSKWREGIIPKLSIDFFNPVKDVWSEEAYEEEIQAKLDCNYFLYCLTPKYTGYFSFAEVINESFHYSNQTIFCFLEEDGSDTFSKEEIDSLKELGSRVVENGGLWLEDLEEVSTFLNSTQEDLIQLKQYDFFISYGRKHSSSLASKLNHAFIKEEKTVWMDKFCIPTGVDFQMSINDGIMKSDNFVYIISPHSVKSEYCTKELEVALKYGKRIIPILHVMEPGLDELMHPEVQKLNWLYFDSERKFQHSFSELLKFTSTDPGYLEANTKWLQKAVEWESHDRDKEFLLGETETILAEAWYDEAIEKEKSPPPSDLNGEFIKESLLGVAYLKRKKKRRGYLIRALSVIMSIAFVVAILFFMQAREAEKIAQYEKGIAQSEKKKALVAQSEAEVSEEKAKIAKEKAEESEEKAKIAKKKAEDSEEVAQNEKKKAQDEKKKAEASEAKAKDEEGKAIIAKGLEEIAKEAAIVNEKKANTLLLQSISNTLFKQANELKSDKPEIAKKAAVLAYELNQDYNNSDLNQDAFEFSSFMNKFDGVKLSTDQAIKSIRTSDDKVFVFDMSGKAYVLESNVSKEFLNNAANKLTDIDVNSQSKIMIASNAENEVLAYKVSGDSPALIHTFIFPGENVLDVHIGEDGIGYVITNNGIYSVNTKTKKTDLLLKRAIAKNAQIKSKEGIVVAILDDVIYNVSNGSEHKMNSSLSAFCFLNKDYLALGEASGKLFRLKLSSMTADRIGSEQHNFEITSIRYSAKNKMLYSCSIDQTVKMWPVKQNGERLEGDVLSYDGYPSWIRDIDFLDADENYLVIGGDSKVVDYIPANYDFVFELLKKDSGKLTDAELKNLIELDNKKLKELRENAN